jgi:hypothetical protein
MPTTAQDGGDINLTYLKMHSLLTVLISFDAVNEFA